jgi:hypothetical protein
MRDLKRVHNYSIPEQEEMLPFERDLLLDMIRGEAMRDADRPDEGWKAYADNIGASKKTRYQDKYRVLDE